MTNKVPTDQEVTDTVPADEAWRGAGPPVSLWALFRGFLEVGSIGLGGGGAAYIHAGMVRRRQWLSEEDFLEGVTFAQLTPGPNFSNLAMFIGSRLGGPLGALLALLAVLLPGTLIVLSLAVLYVSFPVTENRLLQGALHGVASAAVGVLALLVVQTLPTALRSRHGLPVLLLAFLAVGVFHLNIVWVLLILLPYGFWANRPAAGRNGRGG